MQYVSSAKAVVADLRTDGRGKILATVAAGWFLSMGVRMIYPVMLPSIRTVYEMDLTTAGCLLTMLFFLYGLGQLPGGILADRFGERTILIMSTLLSSIMLTLVVTATSVGVLFIATGLFGFGLALYAVARFTLLATVYPDNVGAANGVASAASDAGQSILPPIGGTIAALIAWQIGLGFAIPLFTLTAFALWVTIPSRADEESRPSGTPDRGSNPSGTPDRGSNPSGTSDSTDDLSSERIRYIIAQLRSRSVVLGTASLLFGVCIWQSFTGFYPTYLIEEKALSATRASIVFGLFFALGVLIQPLSGGIYDRVGIRKSLSVVMGIAALALFAVPFIDGFWPLLTITVFVSSLLGFGAITQSHLVVTLPDDMQGTGFGVLRSIAFTASSVSPVLFGAAADRGFFDEGFFVLAVLAGGVVLLSQLFPRE